MSGIVTIDKQRGSSPVTCHSSLSFSPLRELEPFAGAFLAVLFAFLDAGVAGKQAELLELGAQVRVGSNESASNTQPSCSGLGADTAASEGNQGVKPAQQIHSLERNPELRSLGIHGE